MLRQCILTFQVWHVTRPSSSIAGRILVACSFIHAAQDFAVTDSISIGVNVGCSSINAFLAKQIRHDITIRRWPPRCSCMLPRFGNLRFLHSHGLHHHLYRCRLQLRRCTLGNPSQAQNKNRRRRWRQPHSCCRLVGATTISSSSHTPSPSMSL